MTTVEGELRQAGEENRRLRRMLDELTRSYSALYHQLIQAQQQQQVTKFNLPTIRPYNILLFHLLPFIIIMSLCLIRPMYFWFGVQSPKEMLRVVVGT